MQLRIIPWVALAALTSSACEVEVTTLAGNPQCVPPSEAVVQYPPCYADGTGGPNGTAEFANPVGVAVDAQGNVYIGDNGNNCIRKIDAAGNVTTLAGNDMFADLNGGMTNPGGYRDGTGGPHGTAELNGPTGIAVDSEGNVYVADTQNSRIRKIDPSGNVTTLAGNGQEGSVDGTGGPDGTASFVSPVAVAVDTQGNVYVADGGANNIRRIDPSGNVTTIAGNGMTGHVDGTGGADGTAEFNEPTGVAVDAAGNLYVADSGNNRVRRIDQSGNVTTLAGNGTSGFQTYMDGTGGPDGTAQFDGPTGVSVDSRGNVYVADSNNERIREIDPSGNVTTLAGNGVQGYADGTGGAEGGAEFNQPLAVAVDVHGNAYVADTGNNRIRKITQPGG